MPLALSPITIRNYKMNEEVKYAGFWSRLLATAIDTIWLYGLIYSVLWFIFGINPLDPVASYSATQFAFEYLIPLIVVMIFWMKMSATPGKMILGIKIVDAETHEKVSGARLFVRYFAYFISMIPLCLGFFWVAWDKKKQGWHDKIAKTVLIKA